MISIEKKILLEVKVDPNMVLKLRIMRKQKEKKVYNMNNSKNITIKKKPIIYYKLYANNLKKLLDNKEQEPKKLEYKENDKIITIDYNNITIENVLTLLKLSKVDSNNDIKLLKYSNNINNLNEYINNFIYKAYVLKLIIKKKINFIKLIINRLKIYKSILIYNLNLVKLSTNKNLFKNSISKKKI
jgi:hypothetical protein